MTSFAHASKLFSVRGRTVATLFADWAERTPDKAFLIWAPFEGEAQTFSYGEFWALSGQVAAGLAARGTRTGDRIVIHMENAPEFLLTWLACARLGAVAVTTNSKCTGEEIRYFLAKSHAVVVVTQAVHLRMFAGMAQEHLFFLLADAGGDARAFASSLAAAAIEPNPAPGPMDEFSIQFTSGTTSRPKGVVWTQANAVWGAWTTARNLGIRHDDVCQIVLPLFHTNAQVYSLLSTLWVGGALVLQPRFSAARFWSAAVDHGSTWASLIPFCVKAALTQPIPPDHRFRLWVPAVALPEMVDGPLGIRTVGLWGMTETVTPSIIGDPERPAPFMCIGRPAPGYDIEVRGPDGERVGLGGEGRLYVRGVPGVTLFKEYLDDPAATVASFDAAGWFDTGDRVRIAENGDMFFLDREKDMLKVGGENVAASEVEAVILATGLATEVAVVGQRHFMLDEIPVAFVIPAVDAPDDLEDRLIDACRGKLADFKVIRAVHPVAELPRATLEKVAKNVLRERLPEINE
jgi:crotonobetaine/carnitine-CoA ligase